MVRTLRSSVVIAVMLVAGPAFAQKKAPAVDELSLLPADSELVAGLDVQQIQTSLLWKQLVAPMLDKGDVKEGLTKVQQTCGIDPMKAVTRMVIGLKGIGNDQPDGVVVAHGVPKTKIMACYDKVSKQKKASGDITRDGEILIVKPSKDGQPVAMAFVGDATAIVVVGSQATGDGVRAIMKGTTAIKTSAKFVEVYKKTNTQDTLWLIMRGSSKAFDQLRASGIDPMVLFGSVKVTKELSVDLHVTFKNAGEAKKIADMAQSQLKGAAAMFDKITVDAAGTEVKVAIVMSDAKLKELLKQVQP